MINLTEINKTNKAYIGTDSELLFLGIFEDKKLKYLINVGSHVGTTLIPAIRFKLFDHCIALN